MPADAPGLRGPRDHAAFADRTACGRLWATGADARDLLNRLTTNRIDDLGPGQARSTVLTNGDARVIDHLRLAAIDAGGTPGLWCLTSPGRAEAVAEWADRYTFGEDITVEDRSLDTTQLTVVGPDASAALARAGLAAPDVDAVACFDGVDVVASPFGAHAAYDVILPAARAAQAREALRRAASELTGDAFDTYRIAQGVPAYGAEFGEFNNPLEARLLGSISDTKGCYTGQEVIARLQTYRKVQRRLMSFSGDGPAASGQTLEAPDGSSAGTVTSACRTDDGRTAGLALVRSRHAVAGTVVRIVETGTELALAEPAYALATEPDETGCA